MCPEWTANCLHSIGLYSASKGVRRLCKPFKTQISINGGWAPDRYRKSEIALLVTLLAGPVNWLGYTIVLNAMLYERRLNLMRFVWTILCIPLQALAWITLDFSTQFAILGPLYFYGIVLMGSPFVYELYRRQESRLFHSEAGAPVSCHTRSISEGLLEGSWE